MPAYPLQIKKIKLCVQTHEAAAALGDRLQHGICDIAEERFVQSPQYRQYLPNSQPLHRAAL